MWLKKRGLGSLFFRTIDFQINFCHTAIHEENITLCTIDVECFSNCTKLCKPHESNKAVWEIYQNYENLDDENWIKYKTELYAEKDKLDIEHKEFI